MQEIVPDDGRGRATFLEEFLTADESSALVTALKECSHFFANEVVHRREISHRQVLHFRTRNAHNYFYSGGARRARSFHASVLGRKRATLRKRVQTEASRQIGHGVKFNSCIVNRYETVGMGFHSDDTSVLTHDVVAGVSLGRSCNFLIKNKGAGKQKVWRTRAGSRSLIIMHKGMQRHRKHSVSKPLPGISQFRWSVTFRCSRITNLVE